MDDSIQKGNKAPDKQDISNKSIGNTCKTVQTNITESKEKANKGELESQCRESDEIHWSEDLMKDIAKQLDDWDNENVTTEHLQSHRETDNSHEYTRLTANKTSTDNSTFPLDKSQQLQDNGCRNGGTNSRTDFVSHVLPITVLSSVKENPVLVPPSRIICTPSPAMLNNIFPLKTSGQPTSPSSEVCVVKETPPFCAEHHTDHRGREGLQTGILCSSTPKRLDRQPASGFNLASSPRVSPLGRPSDTGLNFSATPNSAVSFRTPSTAEWMKVKRLSNSSTHTPPNFNGNLSSTPVYSGNLVLSSGGKVTPPLCNCGKRAKRRAVSNPGPNEGKTFYACPNGKASDKTRGCGFFKWELKLTSPQNQITSRSVVSTLESEYPESAR